LNRLNDLMPELPEYVKQASVDEEEIAKLPGHLFADTAAREFPLDNPGHVFLSYAYIKSSGVNKPEISRKVKRAATLFKLERDLETLDTLFGPRKEASAREVETAITLDADGKLLQFYPVNTVMEVEDSIQKIGCEKHRLPLILWVEGCRGICKAAKTLGMADSQIPQSIRDYGTERVVDTEHVKWAAEQRVKLTGDGVYRDIAELIENGDEGDMQKYAEIFYQNDLQHDVRYGGGIEDPWQIIYSGTTKEAADRYLDEYFMLADTPVPVSEFAQLSKTALEKKFAKAQGNDLIELVKVASEKGGAWLEKEFASKDSALQRELLSLLVETC
jgi:hypothetical protein